MYFSEKVAAYHLQTIDQLSFTDGEGDVDGSMSLSGEEEAALVESQGKASLVVLGNVAPIISIT